MGVIDRLMTFLDSMDGGAWSHLVGAVICQVYSGFKTQNTMKTIIRNPRNSFNAFPNMFDEIFQDWAQGSVAKPSTVAVNVETLRMHFY